MKINLIVFLLLTSIVFSQTEDKWITTFEKSGFISTADYDQTMKYYQNISDYSEYAELMGFGISPQGRELKCLIVSKDRVFDPVEVKRTNKPIVLIISGIHAGEIEGKDASMILLREILITKEQEYLIDDAVLMVVPIFSVDGHERKSKYNRINQNGPEEMGWRTTAQGYNLNREWMKADASEMQSMLKLISEWIPDFVIDNHTTNGADYQYTITYEVERFANIYSETAQWLDKKFVPFLTNEVNKKGFLIFPYVALRNWRSSLDSGIVDWASGPRLSTGYFSLQNRPSLLVETHMIKPYKERVYSTKAVLETTLDFINQNSQGLVKLNKEADANSIKKLYDGDEYIPISFKLGDSYEEVIFKGLEYYEENSEISGGKKIVYTDKPKDMNIKFYRDVKPADSIQPAKAYLIPQEWQGLVERLKFHGVEISQLSKEQSFNVKRYKFKNIKFNNSSNEGRHRVNFDFDIYSEEVVVPEGTFFVSTNQRTIRIITHLLEPKCSDSFVQWGFLNQIFEQKEYFESYVMEDIAAEMLLHDMELKKEFEEKLISDDTFRNNSYERLNFFYKKSPYWDKQLNLYPIMRID